MTNLGEGLNMDLVGMKIFIALLLCVNEVVIYVWFAILILIHVRELGHLHFMIEF
jgi:hypothetical protein